MLKCIKNAGYDGYSFEIMRNYDNKYKFKNGNLTDQRYYNEVCNYDSSPFELIFVKHRLNTKNNGLIFYLKSMGFELINNKIKFKNNRQEIKQEIKQEIINKDTNIMIVNDTKNIITKSKVVSVKNVIDDNRRIKIFNAFK